MFPSSPSQKLNSGTHAGVHKRAREGEGEDDLSEKRAKAVSPSNGSSSPVRVKLEAATGDEIRAPLSNAQAKQKAALGAGAQDAVNSLINFEFLVSGRHYEHDLLQGSASLRQLSAGPLPLVPAMPFTEDQLLPRLALVLPVHPLSSGPSQEGSKASASTPMPNWTNARLDAVSSIPSTSSSSSSSSSSIESNKSAVLKVSGIAKSGGTGPALDSGQQPSPQLVAAREELLRTRFPADKSARDETFQQLRHSFAELYAKVELPVLEAELLAALDVTSLPSEGEEKIDVMNCRKAMVHGLLHGLSENQGRTNT